MQVTMLFQKGQNIKILKKIFLKIYMFLSRLIYIKMLKYDQSLFESSDAGRVRWEQKDKYTKTSKAVKGKENYNTI